MWEYSFRDEKFEIIIRVKHNPCVDALSLNYVSQSMDALVDEMAKRIRNIMDCEYCGKMDTCKMKLEAQYDRTQT